MLKLFSDKGLVFKQFLFVILCFYVHNIAYSATSKTLTILSWWSYFDNEWIQEETAKICRVQLAVQSYKDANEFSKSFELKDYDIAIYESSQFKQVAKEIGAKDILRQLDKKKLYYPCVEKIYDAFIDKHNTAFFLLSNTVFLYNPQHIALSDDDTLPKIIKKLKINHSSYPLIILDDPVIINTLVEQEIKGLMTTSHFKKLFNYKNLVISNDYIDYKNMGAFFTWSGEAIYHKQLAKKQGIKLKILTIPRYSYVTADLLSVLSDSKEAACVANLFTSEAFLQRLQENSFYYSPFLKYKHMKKSIYRNLYEEFERTLIRNEAKWVLPSREELHRAIRAWEKVVFDYGL